MHNVVAVDGYIADENDEVGPLFEWYSNGDNELMPGFGVSRSSFDYVRPMWDSIGSMVIGRHLFDLTNGWEGRRGGGGERRRAGARARPRRRGRDGRRSRGLRPRQTLLRAGRRAAPA